MSILLTGATGMFGGAVLKALREKDKTVRIRAVARNLESIKNSELGDIPGVDWVYADFWKTETLDQALDGIERAFMVTPMSSELDVMEINFINAAKRKNVKKLYKLFGAVDHKGKDPIGIMHDRSVNYLKNSGLAWTLISPNSVMETCFLNPMALENFKQDLAMYCCSGHHKIGFVALEDVALASAHLMISNHQDYQNYQFTGPQALDYFEVANIFSKVLGETVQYVDFSVHDFKEILIKATGMVAEEVELQIMCHCRAWSEDRADLVTDTYKNITHNFSTSLESWVNKHRGIFL